MMYTLKVMIILTAMMQFARADTRSFVCNFDERCVQIEDRNSSAMELTYFVQDDGLAFIQGNSGLVPVFRMEGDHSITFLEPIGLGAVQSTTILFNGNSIRSHHTHLFGKFIPSQWLGKCNFFGDS